MRLIDADEFDRMAKEQHEMWARMMEAEEKYRLIDIGLLVAANVADGMPTIEAAVIDRDTRQSLSFAVANLCADALFSGKLDAADKKRVMAHVRRLNTLAGLESAASKIARALLPEAAGQSAPGGEQGEIIHVYENSRLSSAHFTVEAVTAAYVEGLAALYEVDALRAERDALWARCEVAERDLAVERGCPTCWYLDHDCPADCDCNGSRWKWRGVDRLDDAQSALGDDS